jgi:two-component system, chemotaxis family, sensor kinase CheA
MNESTGGSQSASAGIDLSQFHQVFFEEAGENLERMEQQLLEVDIESADDETLNSIFRCAHSVKGGAATFGFTDVAELTHQMETLLDKLRRHELQPTPAMVDVLLQSGDALKAQLARHQNPGSSDAVDTAALLVTLRNLVSGQAPAMPAAPAPAAHTATAPAPAPEAAGPSGQRALELVVGPLDSPADANNLVDLFSEIAELGTIEPLDGGQAADGMRRFKIITASSDNDLLDLFTFHVSREHVKLSPLTAGYGFHAGAPGAPLESSKPADDATFGFFDNAPGAPGAGPGQPSPAAAVAAAAPPANKPAAAAAKPVAAAEAATLRVSVEKIDQLINLVGELVITQAMLAETGAKADPALFQHMAARLADLERNTRGLQESVMSIRMIPMSAVFNRFPRMLRDLAGKLNKKVELVTLGEATELDKGLVEKITDPLTHLVRNSCDHGIELPAERAAKGKSETGTITLAASHQGGSIVIEVRDDGKGLSREKLLKKARERGIAAPDTLLDGEVWSLIFAPGFSTAEVVTDVSGRGVGMDVVKKNITALGGTVEIDSAEGYGMSVKVRLPLTLAIMDGMSVGVADECYILPLASVVESFQFTPDKIKTVGGNAQVVQVREEFLPVVELEHVFKVPRNGRPREGSITVVIESEGARMALVVDELLGQQQVVVKNLETNYRKVDHISGATIMGDGGVALILDVASLVRCGRH